MDVVEFKGGGVRVVVRNGGNAASPQTELRLFVYGGAGGGAVLIVPALAPGKTASLQFSGPAPGTRYQVMVDPQNAIAEFSETNNRPLAMTVPQDGAGGSPPVLAQGPVVKTVPTLRFVGDVGQTGGAFAPIKIGVAPLVFQGAVAAPFTSVTIKTQTLSFVGATSGPFNPISRTTPSLVFVGKP